MKMNLLKLFSNKEVWKNKETYLSLFAFALMVLASYNVQLGPDETLLYENLLKSVLDILILFGILNNPTTGGYSNE